MPTIKQIAQKVYECMNMKPGETLAVRGGVHTQELVEEIALIGEKNGIETSIVTTSDNFVKRYYKEVPLKYFGRTPKLSMKMADILNARIMIESPSDPRILENVDQKKIAAHSAAMKPVSDKIDKNNVKGVIVGWPSRGLAEQLGCKFSTLKRFTQDAIMVDSKVLWKKGIVIKKKLQGANYVHIHDEHGTDLTLRMGNRKIMIADGYASDSDIRHGDVWQNLPDGETFTTPIETFAEGKLVSPLRRDYFTEKPIKDIELVFEHGKLNLQKTKAGYNNKLLHDTLKRAMAIDRKNGIKNIRTTHPAELGIGTNPIIDKIIGYLLTDEKIFGTIHVALGKNNPKTYGGKSDSVMHWDFITNKGVNLDVIKGKKTIPLLVKGKLARD